MSNIYEKDVRWNYGIAKEAEGALRKAVSALENSADERRRLAQTAQAQWRGAHREKFDQQLAKMLRDAHDLASTYRRMANQIAHKNDEAWKEQLTREKAREKARKMAKR